MPGQRNSTEGHALLLLGDSIVYGWGVAPPESLAAQLERRLAGRRGSPWRVINAGVPGDTVLMGCLRYERDVAAHHPQVVLLSFGLNDAALRRTRFDIERERLWQARRWPWARLIHIAERRLIKPMADRWKHRMQRQAEEWFDLAPTKHEKQPRVRPRLFVAGLLWLARQARRDGAEVHFMTMVPVAKEALSTHQAKAYSLYDELIHHASRRTHAPLIDLAEAAATFDHARMLAADGIHLTAAGYRWLASTVWTHLAEKSRSCL
ncbi:MAG: hypothetical protein H5T69_07060 [Chloroflexi bacterium]|nr:hypothetical protein [Chloroflexota bacterium]